ncbi:hypothetical protein RUND412_001340 [Rhizina undulata]
MPRERRKWTETEDAILREAVLKGGDGASDWHLIASCIPGRTNKDCRKRWHYKVAATVNKGPWEVAEDERLWAAVQEHGSRWALVAQVVKTRNGDQCSKRWYDALDPSIDHSPWTPDEDARLLEAIENNGRNWKAIVKAYFPRRTSLSAKNRHSLLIRKMEHKGKSVSAKAASKRAQKFSSTVSPTISPTRREKDAALPILDEKTDEDSCSTNGDSTSLTYEHPYRSHKPLPPFDSPTSSHIGTPDFRGSSVSSACPMSSPSEWNDYIPNSSPSAAKTGFSVTRPLMSDAPMFLDDLRLSPALSHQGFGSPLARKRKPPSSVPPDVYDVMNPHAFSINPRNDRSPLLTPEISNNDGHPQVFTVLINSEVTETVNSIVERIGREDGVSIAIHLG